MQQHLRLTTVAITAIAQIGLIFTSSSAWGLPPPEDTPEEVLRTAIITEARSPIDGEPLTAAEYAELQAQLQTGPETSTVDPKLQEIIVLLRLRQAIRTFFPFLLK